MSYPGYPPQNPSYPQPPNLPYPINPASNPVIGFSAPYPGQQQQTTYPPLGPSPAYPNAQYPNAGAYPPTVSPYPTSTAPYPGAGAPYPGAGAPYPTGGAPAYPPMQQSAPYPAGGMNQMTYGGPSYPAQQPLASSQTYPQQHAAPPYNSAVHQPHATSHSAPTYGSSPNHGAHALHPTVNTAAPEKKMTPTIRPKEPFNARQDAEGLKKAMKGFGTNEKAIIDILAFRTNKQRQEITAQYKALFGKDLIKDLKSELSGKFEDIIMATMMPLPEYFARELHDAMAGLGTHEGTLIEVLCTLNNAWIHAINNEYMRVYKKSLESDIKGDTSGYFQRLLVALCQGRRDENPNVDMAAASADAHSLYTAGQGKLGTDESTFNMILVSRSLPQLRQIFTEYEKMFNTKFETVVRNEFSGSIEQALLAIVKAVRNCSEFFADRLYNSMSGAGTNDRTLIRIIVTRSEFDLGDIKIIFQSKYKKSLASFIQGDTSGDYKNMLLAMTGN